MLYAEAPETASQFKVALFGVTEDAIKPLGIMQGGCAVVKVDEDENVLELLGQTDCT